jgi:hypothetical protein
MVPKEEEVKLGGSPDLNRRRSLRTPHTITEATGRLSRSQDRFNASSRYVISLVSLDSHGSHPAVTGGCGLWCYLE